MKWKLLNMFFLVITLPFLLFSRQDEGLKIKQATKYLEQRGEVIIRIEKTDVINIEELSKILSIDKVTTKFIQAYANQEDFSEFLKLNIDFDVQIPPSLLIKPRFFNTSSGDSILAKYPSYEEYIALMDTFSTKYPELCRLEKIGESINGRDILFVKISDNVNTREAEPEFMYSSTMHGDETAGYVLLLKLIDYLLSNYDSIPKIKHMVDHMEIWINPLANPDGTYFGGNSSVSGAKRYNVNNIDLNRNFPDPEDGEHPDGKEWQPENVVMMDFMKKHQFVMSANIHGGAEVVNYPWDTWEKRHADDAWFQFISRQYADTAILYSDNYLTGFDNGVINGYDWYSISGGRQDYVTYFLHGREVTLELSKDKTPPASLLDDLWEYNYRSLLNYMEQSLYGISGFVTDSVTGDPLKAKIQVLNHDKDSSLVYANLDHGNYHRLIGQGMYSLTFSADSYITKVVDSVEIKWNEKKELNVQLVHVDTSNGNKTDDTTIIDTNRTKIEAVEGDDLLLLNVYPNPFYQTIYLDKMNIARLGKIEIFLYNIIGTKIPIEYMENDNFYIIKPIKHELPPGMYVLRVLSGNESYTCKLFKK